MANDPPRTCYAVVFTSQRTPADAEGYAAAAERMEQLARTQPGFLGIESARGADGVGITVSYWESEEAIRRWHADSEHQAVQRLGRERWYEWFRIRVCRVERAHTFRCGMGF